MTFRQRLRPLVTQARAIARYTRLRFQRSLQAPVGREPAFDPETKAWFIHRLASTRSYLEYGAGASTLLAAEAGIAAISIESEPRYAQAVRDMLPPRSSNLIVGIDIGATEEWGYPLWTLPTKRAILRWQKYPFAGPAHLNHLPSFPDLILIDGRFRVASCLVMVKASIEKRAGTQILFDDYTLRPHYRSVEAVLGEPEIIGRAALFFVDPDTIDGPKLEAAIAEAIRDYR